MSEPPSIPAFKSAKRSRPTTLKKRQLSQDPDDATAPSEVIISTKKATSSYLVQTTGLSLKRRKAEAEANERPLTDSEDEAAPAFEVRHSATTSRPRRRSSSPPAEVSAAEIKANKKGEKVDVVLDDGMYHGKAGAAHKLPQGFGPIKGGPSNVKTITLIDYQPDVCKDYKGAYFIYLVRTYV